MTSTKYPKVTWETGIHHEALRLLYYLKRLPERELQNRGFLILPKSNPKLSDKIIVIPDLDYSSLWKKASRLNPTTPMTAPETLVDQTISLLRDSYQPLPTAFLKLEKTFFDSLFIIIPEYKSTIKYINFIVTHCGTSSQFNTVGPKQSTLTIYLRPDTPLSSIYRVIILSLIRDQLQLKESRSWEEIMVVADFILNHTLVSQKTSLMPKLQNKQSSFLHQQSEKYLSHLGIPQENCWSLKNNQIFYQSIQITNLTNRQNNLLQLLIKNYGQIVSLDDIAKILWPNDEDYSLWAIVKEVARIRKCLVNNNLPGSLIKSHRKMGYSLS